MITTKKAGIALILAIQTILVGKVIWEKNMLDDIFQDLYADVKHLGNPSANRTRHDSINSTKDDEQLKASRIDIPFAFAGFEQCGAIRLAKTTNLIPKIFFGNNNNNNETSSSNRVRDDQHLRSGNMHEFELNYQREGTDIADPVINTFKSSQLLRSNNGLKHFVQHFPNTDLVVAVRHPVLHFMSEYNFFYRNEDVLPQPKRFIGACKAHCASTTGKCLANVKFCSHLSYFHHWLSRLSLTPSDSQEELELLGDHGLSYHPNWKGRLFLVQHEQLVDENSTRRHSMERTYEHYIGVQEDAYNSTISIKSRKQLVDICHTDHTAIRYEIIREAEITAKWIKMFLLESDRVVVPNKKHFLELLESWSIDPCIQTMEKLAKIGTHKEQSKDDVEGIHKKSIRKDANLVDFAIGGFAKCGTTTLMASTAKVPQVFMGNNDGREREVHDLRRSFVDQFQNRYKDHRTYFSKDGTRLLNGFKSPEILQSQDFLVNMLNHLPSIDLVITTRHPVLHFQSAYNYKYRNVNRTVYKLPEPVDLIGKCTHDCRHDCVPKVDHKAVCTEKAYFHYGLSRLHLTPLETEKEKELLDHHHLSIHPSWNGRLFLMEIGQLADSNLSRKNNWERSYEQFLGIIPNSFDTNVTHENGRSKDKIVNICDDEHRPVREVLVEVGIKASNWIREYLLKSDRVIVANREHFLALIEKWKFDPCDA